MELIELANILDFEQEGTLGDFPDTIVKGLSYRSQDVQEGYIFVAIKGYHQDGHNYIEHAIENGACAVVGEKPITGLKVPYIQVDNSRKALGLISDHFYDYPTHNKTLIGITGTNGKTTTSFLLRHILEGNGYSCALFGSTKNIVNGESFATANTTPNLLEINRLLSKSDDDVVVMEVSSHALTQYRVEGITFDYALFTNLSHDHLDYHDSMEDYFEAKRKLFDMLKAEGQAVINTDDYWGEQLASQLESQAVSTVSIGENAASDVRIAEYTSTPRQLLLTEKHERVSIEPKLYGLHNMYNIAMAYGTARQIGVDSRGAVESIESFDGVEGRFNRIELESGVTCIVDYAHTPDALFHSLNAARELCEGDLIHLFGFRGDRDPSKRGEMISISSELSDRYILTFDDLNSVSPSEMEESLIRLQETYGNEKAKVITDRTLAIAEAIKTAEKGDCILITGKGLEKYQQDYHHPVHNDKEAVLYLGGI
ncbi:UDP-N-acetylmuramoyl-L-alanyl-D-glutamate--2,6-diaminopimelate ligase [Halobacillus salinus]|uniref:UDP-N-acetylmuramyl-tripeptide synthetase n=1 Tax=Halobacillus salinus TaxID=192814 RepID=A0A4Z0GX22_9BACI|nr:UDP-N-acetylmuramoyl-L-alanyl-D-glutamate--2,6-diaminopimelate ligase [Halobacillus salinus]TGB01079.1 UDP-N-acetylmuramoyl-L-alanyl-D-glutamate--2,6-diaminopimelate ligase [Halobacillus salinus]